MYTFMCVVACMCMIYQPATSLWYFIMEPLLWTFAFLSCSCQDHEDQGQQSKVQGAMLQVSLHTGSHWQGEGRQTEAVTTTRWELASSKDVASPLNSVMGECSGMWEKVASWWGICVSLCVVNNLFCVMFGYFLLASFLVCTVDILVKLRGKVHVWLIVPKVVYLPCYLKM